MFSSKRQKVAYIVQQRGSALLALSRLLMHRQQLTCKKSHHCSPKETTNTSNVDGCGRDKNLIYIHLLKDMASEIWSSEKN